MSDLRAGVIGVGYLGNFHAEKYQKIPGVQLVGVVDTNPERAERVAYRYGVKAYKDYKELLPNINLVSIVVPSVKHYPVAKDCLNAGIHCLVEKPLTELVPHATELIATARQKKAVLQVGHLERFNPVVQYVKDGLREKKWGDLISISAIRVSPSFKTPKQALKASSLFFMLMSKNFILSILSLVGSFEISAFF